MMLRNNQCRAKKKDERRDLITFLPKMVIFNNISAHTHRANRKSSGFFFGDVALAIFYRACCYTLRNGLQGGKEKAGTLQPRYRLARNVNQFFGETLHHRIKFARS